MEGKIRFNICLEFNEKRKEKGKQRIYEKMMSEFSRTKEKQECTDNRINIKQNRKKEKVKKRKKEKKSTSRYQVMKWRTQMTKRKT